MTYGNWIDAVEKIRQLTESVTTEQRNIAALTDVSLPEDLPRVVAATRLKEVLYFALDLPPAAISTCGQSEYLRKFRSKKHVHQRSTMTKEEASAWISFYFLSGRIEILERLELNAGDIVEIERHGEVCIEEISSISERGRLYFKGGAGAGAWPDTVKRVYRKTDTGSKAKELIRTAANNAAARKRTDTWSESKKQQLSNFEVLAPLVLADIEELESTIDAAVDESKIQKFLMLHPQLLTGLLGGKELYCLPKAKLGNAYVPDFLISDVDSLGVRWLLIELETPTSGITLKKGNDLDQYSRKGVSQIKEWREWLLNNLDYARRPKRENGLGLIDIRPESEGLVLVGRRDRLHTNASALRHSYRERNSIQIHTYDWLIERLRGVLDFRGPPAANPFLLQPQRHVL